MRLLSLHSPSSRSTCSLSRVLQMSQDAKLFTRGKVEELRAELQADKKDKSFAKRKVTLKKVRLPCRLSL